MSAHKRAPSARPGTRTTARAGREVCHPGTPPQRDVRALRTRPGSDLIDGTDTPPQGGARHDHHSSLDPELQAFAQWFADWWLRRGRDLTDPSRMTDSTQRAVAYVRESTEEQGQGFSPDAQRQGIAASRPRTISSSSASTATSTPAGASQRRAPSSSA